MAITKQYLKSKPVCKVTFMVPVEEASSVAVVGDFNDWTAGVGMLKKLKNGVFKGTFDLPKDNEYQFRYIVDGTYINDTEADGYKWNSFAGTENALLVI